MRWEALFADIEAQAQMAALVERAAEVDERARLETARLRLVDRLRPSIGAAVRLHCAGQLRVGGTLRQVGAQWVLIDERADQQALVPLTAIYAVAGAGWLSAVPGSEGAVTSRLGLASALRAIARERAGVRTTLADATEVAGTIDRVGADALELAVHPVGQPRRRACVREVMVVSFAAIALIRRGIGAG